MSRGAFRGSWDVLGGPFFDLGVGFRSCGLFWVPSVWVFVGFRSCGLFWVPFVWVVLGSVRVGCLGFRPCGFALARSDG